MGLFPQMMLAALIVAAFALSSQQRLAIGHGGPDPARQVAYLLRTYHRSAVAFKQANPAAAQTIVAGPAGMTGFVSCADGTSVVTTIQQSYGTARDQQIAGELVSQSLNGRAGLGVPGVGLSDGVRLKTGFGPVALPANCAVDAGLPAMQTQVLP